MGDSFVASHSDLSQQGFELGEDLFDRVEVGRVFQAKRRGAADVSERPPHGLSLGEPGVDSDAKCNPVDSIGSSTKSRVSHSERRPSARFPGDEDGSARRNIEPLQ